MEVTLLHNTPLWVCSKAIRKCWASEDKSDNGGELDKALIHRIGNKHKHSSTLEHLNYSFDIDGISRACLQELARHRHASMSVKSTRYTLKELKEEADIFVSGYTFLSEEANTIAPKYLVFTKDPDVDGVSVHNLAMLQKLLKRGKSNDIGKYPLPEAYKTSLVWTINARSLQNFLSLRTSPSALWEIRELALEVFKQLPEEHKYLFEEFIYDQVRETAQD